MIILIVITMVVIMIIIKTHCGDRFSLEKGLAREALIRRPPAAWLSASPFFFWAVVTHSEPRQDGLLTRSRSLATCHGHTKDLALFVDQIVKMIGHL